MNDLIPNEFYLFQNYPNPFKDKTIIKYCMAFKTKVRITIYNSDGEMIYKLVNEVKEAGTYEVKFSVSDLEISNIQRRAFSIKHPVSSSFFYQMKAGDYLSEKEMIIIKENKSVQSK